MCGIAGYVGAAPPEERVAACLALMRRRGPDAQAAYRTVTPGGTAVGLLHSRLAIVDLDERSDQPFRDGPRVLVYNGEVYNHVELRDALGRQGAPPFTTTGDTEVLMRLLARDGVDGLDRCEGMWAFALYDEERQTLLLSRDRFGEKPLYLWRTGGTLYFGSEVKFLTCLAGQAPAVDRSHLLRYMVNGYKALYKQPATFFEGVEELPAGTCRRLDLRAGTETEQRYWTPGPVDRDESQTYDEAVAAARDALVRALEIRLRADVPLAFCLSGGVDSNALIAIAKRLFGYDVHGFTIINTDERYEERHLVDLAVRELGLRHTAVPIETTGFLDRLRTLVRHHDAPVYTITYYVQWLLLEQVKKHGYRISISGTAADELFSGYFDHHNAYLQAVAGDPALHAEALGHWQRTVAPLVRNPFLQNPHYFVERPDARDHIYLNADEFSALTLSGWSEPFREEAYSGELLRNRMLNELFHESVPPILHEDDLNAMWHSIENRSPFLDRKLFETCQRIPTRHLVRRGCAKAVLRDAVRGIAPDAIVDNPRKVGFNAPIHNLLDTRDPDVRAYLLDDGPVFEYVHKERIAALIDKAHLPNSESKFLFYFLNAKIFLEEFG